MVYFIVFSLAILSIKIAELLNNVRLQKYFMFFSAIFLVFLAALRDESIGIDVLIYQKPIFLIAKHSHSFLQYIQNTYIQKFEIAYVILTYIASRFGGIFWVFLFNQIVIILFVFLSIWYYRDQVSPHLSLACFLFVYYLHGYNITRQSIAMAILLYVVVLAEQKKYIQMCIFELLAFGFHTSAIVGVGIIFLYFAGKGHLKKMYTILIILGVLISIFFFRSIFVWAVNAVPFLPKKYISKQYLYLDGGTNFTFVQFLYVIGALIILLCITNFAMIRYVKNYDFLLYMMLFALGGITVGSQATFANRVFMYMEMFSIFVIPQSMLLIKRRKYNRLIGEGILYIALISFWLFCFVLNNYGNVYPYMLSSELL